MRREDEMTMHIYEAYNNHVYNCDRLLAERTNIFLMSNSILFIGFAMLVQVVHEMEAGWNILIILPAIGIFAFFIILLINGTQLRELCFWLRCCRTLEEEEDLFNGIREQGGKGKELAPHTAWYYWAYRKGSRYETKRWETWDFLHAWFRKGKDEKKLGGKYKGHPCPSISPWRDFYHYIFRGWKMCFYYIITPILFFCIWLASLIWVCHFMDC